VGLDYNVVVLLYYQWNTCSWFVSMFLVKHYLFVWTLGCVGVLWEQVEEIFNSVDEGTSERVLPRRISSRSLSSLSLLSLLWGL
jgi:hypothetical protein